MPHKRRQDLRKLFFCIAAAACLLSACSAKSELVIERNEDVFENVRLQSQSEPEEDEMISVYICGAVKEPGVYELPQGSRLLDLVTTAGGFLESVDERAFNLASVLKDGQQITVFTKEELEADPEAAIYAGPSEGSLVNINTADKERLMTLPGIGESRAMAIIAYREENGGFVDVEDIKNISGIGDKMFERLSGLIEV